MRSVALYFDFVSPYAWLALCQAPAFAARHGVAFALRPVVYGALLDAHGLVGPAEVEGKRRYTFVDVARCAHALQRPFRGPPAHPFRSLEALRVATLFADSPRALDLVVALAAECWEQGADLTDAGVLTRVVRDAGLDATDLSERIAAAEVKQSLRRATEDAIAAGVFGVPTFAWDGQLFWGHDRMGALADALAGRGIDTAGIAELLARPRGADRRARPSSPPGGSR